MTQPLRVENANFLLERLAADCAPYQYVRELTQNGLEACAKNPSQEGLVIWDLDWELLEQHGVYKAQVIDTGCGMTKDELLRYPATLSSSGNVQALDRNYGLGAKISAGVTNPLGMVYTSIVEDAEYGNEVKFGRDENHDYGLIQFRESGRFAYSVGTEKEFFHEEIRNAGHGTQITLLGNTEEENTFRPQPSQWFLQKYLNQRYFRFPKGIEVHVRQLPGNVREWPRSREDISGNKAIKMRRVYGQKHYLDGDSEMSGHLDIGNAIVHWWVMKDVREKAMAMTKGHVAAIYQDELYEMSRRRRDLYRFGVYNAKAASRVVIYLQPKILPHQKVIPTASRSSLRVNNGQALPWDEWAEEFIRNMPAELDEFIKSFDDPERNNSEAVRQEMQKHKDLYDLQAYRRVHKSRRPFGTDEGDDEILADAPVDPPPKKRGRGGASRGGPRKGQSLRVTKGRRIEDRNATESGLNFPTVIWVTVEDGTRTLGDELEDRAAEYMRSAHTLHINGDFRLVLDLKERAEREWNQTGNPDIREIIEREVHEGYELALTEAVVGVLGMQGSSEWTPEDLFDKALSPEGLTTAVQSRISLWTRVNRRIGSHASRIRKALVSEQQEAEANVAV